jgi:tungstate transport system permease protein
MNDLTLSLGEAFALIRAFDAKLVEIVVLSLGVSLSAVAIAAVLGLPLGALFAVGRFRGRQAVIVLLNALMGLPPVVVGLLVYLLLSRAGPLGSLGVLFTPTAMIIAQVILITPIIAALSRQSIEDAWHEYEEQLRSLGANRLRASVTLLWDTRFSLVTILLAGFGRAAAEVGAVMIVGDHSGGTRGDVECGSEPDQGSGVAPLRLSYCKCCRWNSTRCASRSTAGRLSTASPSRSAPDRAPSYWVRTGQGKAC